MDSAPASAPGIDSVFNFSGKIEFVHSELKEAIFTAPEGDAAVYPLVLIPYDCSRIANNYIGNPPFMTKIISDTVLKGKDVLIEINPHTAKELMLAEGKAAELNTPKGKAVVKVHLSQRIGPGLIAMAKGLGHWAGGPYLAEKGYDVWLANLRGRSPGSHPGDGSGRQFDWNVDTYIRHDVPAIIEHVCKRTGSEKVTWIGHSMGGIVIFSHTGAAQDRRIANIVAVASPLRFIDMDRRIYRLVKLLGRYYQKRKAILLGTLARWGSPSRPGVWLKKYMDIVVNLDNVSDNQWNRYLFNSVIDIPSQVAFQIGGWSRDDVLQSYDGKFDYRPGMKNIQVPVLVLTGNMDLLAPPRTVEPTMDMISSKDKTCMILSRQNGAKADYGHLDILIGPHAKSDAFEHIESWLAKHY